MMHSGVLMLLILIVSYVYEECYLTNLDNTKVVLEVEDEYDYIIVGGGTAGCVLAARLSEIPENRVLLLEGGSSHHNLVIRNMWDYFRINIPGMVEDSRRTELDWSFVTTPQNHTMRALKHKQALWSSGKLLGGSSQLNYMMHGRGDPEDYAWSENGEGGWSYQGLLKYFKKLENYVDPLYSFFLSPSSSNPSSIYGSDGPIPVTIPEGLDDITENFIAALNESGIPFYPNKGQNSDTLKTLTNIQNGYRMGVAQTYLQPVLHRPNLSVLTNTYVTKILFDSEKRARGVRWFSNEQERNVFSKNRIIVSAGTVGSAKLLMLSGIGLPEELEPLNISVVSPLPVGKTINDQLMVVHSPLVVEQHSKLNNIFSLSSLWEYFILRRGFLASCLFPVTSYTTLSDENGETITNKIGVSLFVKPADSPFSDNLNLDTENHFTRESALFPVAFLYHPKSTGDLKLRSNNPSDPPIIEPNYLSNHEDFVAVVTALKLLGKVRRSFSRKMYPENTEEEAVGLEREGSVEVKGELEVEGTAEGTVGEVAVREGTVQAGEGAKGEVEVISEAGGNTESQEDHDDYTTDEQYHALARFNTVFTNHQPTGSCRMGSDDDPRAVVDYELQVRGVTNLMVVDASVIPSSISGGNHLTVIAIAEKIAEMLIEKNYMKWPLRRESQSFEQIDN